MYRVKQTTAATVTTRGGINYTKRRGLQCMARLVWEAARAKSMELRIVSDGPGREEL